MESLKKVSKVHPLFSTHFSLDMARFSGIYGTGQIQRMVEAEDWFFCMICDPALFTANEHLFF